MDLVKQSKIIDSIHDTLNDMVGQRLCVRENMGRSKIVEDEGVITQTHPRLFIMEVDRKRGRTVRKSFQYADILTGIVKLTKDGEPVFENFIEEDLEDSVVDDLMGALSKDLDEISEEDVEKVIF